MLKGLWSILSKDKDEAREERVFDRARFRMLLDHFPIGKKPRYYPEYRQDVVFHTIILAYRVNEHYLYSRDAVLIDDEGLPTGFRLEEGGIIPWKKIERFQLLLPDTTELEKKLDYFTRAELGRAGQFGMGNAITLVSDAFGRGVPTVETQVDRRQMIQSGPYANSSTILITPDFSTLAISDKRKKQRVQADIRAELYGANAPPIDCVLSDFSESALRLRVPEGQEALTTGSSVIVEFSFGDVASAYRIKGRVIRRAADICVVGLERIYRDGEFDRIKMMDVMEIKTQILNLHP